MARSAQLDRLLAKMEAAKRAPREAIRPALMQSGEELAGAMRRLAEASRDSGDLIESITVTGPGEQTPPYSQPGGSRVAGEAEVLVAVGNSDVRYPHLVEYGTADTEAQPFFWPAYRLLRKRLQGRIKRAAAKAVREELAR
jgi:HK97 gp10 family phage protein